MRQIQDSPSGYLSENYNYMKLFKTNCLQSARHITSDSYYSYYIGKNIWYGLCKRVYLQFRTFCHFMGSNRNYFLIIHHKKQTASSACYFFASSFSSLYIGRGIHHMDIWRTRHYACPPRRTTDLFHRFQRNFPPATFQHHTKPI